MYLPWISTNTFAILAMPKVCAVFIIITQATLVLWDMHTIFINACAQSTWRRVSTVTWNVAWQSNVGALWINL